MTRDLQHLAATIAGKRPDLGTRAAHLRQGVSAGPNAADRQGTIRVTLDGATVAGVSCLGPPTPAGQPVWLLEVGGRLLAIGYPGAGGDPNRLDVGQSTLPRLQATSTGISMTSQLLRLSFFTATRTEDVTQLRLVSGGTAAGATPTLCRAGVYTVDPATGDLTLAASIASDTALFGSTNTQYTRSLTSTLPVLAGQRLAVGFLVVTAATAPTLAGYQAMTSAELAVAPRLSASRSGQSDLPSTITAGDLSTSGGIPYAALLPA